MRSLILAALALLFIRPVSAEAPAQPAPIAVISAFAPEWQALAAQVTDPHQVRINGVPFVRGRIRGKPVVLMMSGISMVNAAMNTQLLLDHYHVRAIVFSGIAGGLDPSLNIGDVAVPGQWRQALETVFARETPDGFKPEHFGRASDLANFGMMFPNRVQVGNQATKAADHDWFAVDPDLLAVAQRIAPGSPLQNCLGPDHCLAHQPQVVVGGNGLSGSAFVDNKAYREYLFATFHGRVFDMESAAVAQVAFANQVPFIVFRSLSDLAGGDAADNQMTTFMALAAGNSAAVVSRFIAALP
jgi:adenosylhomocysteine nucleosidase